MRKTVLVLLAALAMSCVTSAEEPAASAARSSKDSDGYCRIECTALRARGFAGVQRGIRAAGGELRNVTRVGAHHRRGPGDPGD